MKWIVLGLLLLGIVLMAVAVRADKSASFDDGSFLITSAIGLVGVGCFAVGLIWGAILLFVAL